MKYSHIHAALLASLTISALAYAADSLQSRASESWDAEKYAKASSPQFEAGTYLLEEVNFGEDARVLDIGCGVGDHAAWVLAQGKAMKVVGIDHNKSMIEKAREKYHTNENLLFDEQDVRNLDHYEDASFDGAFSVFCLHWIPKEDLPKAFAEIARVLKPGARFLAVFNIADTDAHPVVHMRAINVLMRSGDWSGYFPAAGMSTGNNCSMDDFKKAISYRDFMSNTSDEPLIPGTNIFKSLTCTKRSSKDGHFRTVAECKSFLGALPLITYIPDERKNEFLDALIAQMQIAGVLCQGEGELLELDLSMVSGFIDVTKVASCCRK